MHKEVPSSEANLRAPVADNTFHDNAWPETYSKQSDQRSEKYDKADKKDGRIQYAMRRAEDGTMVPMRDVHGRKVLFPTDDVLKSKLNEFSRLHRFDPQARFLQAAASVRFI